MRQILIAGGGPAGGAAAISASLAGCGVRLMDRATAVRHKVCGEFISPGAAEILESLQVWREFVAAGPSTIRKCVLHAGRHTKQWKLSDSGWGLSRFRLDGLLLAKAAELGATVTRGEIFAERAYERDGAFVLACGRRMHTSSGERFFGFKSHFEGPRNDTVELFFDDCGYVGVSSVEDGLTNVCGIAPESVLRRRGFDFDEIVRRSAPLAARVGPLRRRMQWLAAGPLSFSNPSRSDAAKDCYPAGDALGFVDPFTGSGILNALTTGRLAGMAAARGIAAAEYLRNCRQMLRRPFQIASWLRAAIERAELHWMIRLVPGRALFRLTRASASDLL